MRQQHLYDKNVSHSLKAERQKQECGNRSSATLQSEFEGRKEWNGKEGGFRFSLPFCIHSKQPSASHTYSHFFKAILTFCSIYKRCSAKGKKGGQKRTSFHHASKYGIVHGAIKKRQSVKQSKHNCHRCQSGRRRKRG